MSLNQSLKDTLTFVLAGGQGERLKPLTETRAKPAVTFGGSYRIIDFTLSNCIHSGLRRIHVLTQYQARSLEEHIRFGWNFLPRRLEQFIGVSPPHHGLPGRWYAGTADAIYQNLDSIEQARPEHVLILSGDHIYKMDYGPMIRRHLETDATVTIGAVRIPQEESSRFGVFETDERGLALSFEEKPETGAEIPGSPGVCLGSMGIYLFKTDELVARLREDAEFGDASSHDFGKDVIPRMIPDESVWVYHFTGRRGSTDPYWRDVGTIEAYFDANLDLCSVQPQFNLYDTSWPIYTLWQNDPPAKTVFDGSDGRRAEVVDSLLCPGTVVSGASVKRSVLSNRVIVEEGAELEEAILFKGAVVGPGAKLRRVIVDRWTRIPEGEEIGYDADRDRERFRVTSSGITVVPPGYEFG
jgi:glucose-1-phosphate adenylyltransferase